MSELFTYGSVGGTGGNPGPYPEIPLFIKLLTVPVECDNLYQDVTLQCVLQIIVTMTMKNLKRDCNKPDCCNCA